MKWFLNWAVSIIAIYLFAYIYKYYSSISELIKTIDWGGFLFIFIAGAFSSSCSILLLWLLETLFVKLDIRINKTVFLILSMIVTVIICAVIVKKLSIILTET
jgi:hypothetical protein